MKVALVQFDIVWEDAEANARTLAQMTASLGSVDLIVLPELWPVGFTMNDRAWESEAIALDAMRETAQRCQAWILGGVPQRRLNQQANCAVVMNRQGLEVGRYAKMKLFAFAGEDRHYAAGSKATVIDINGFPVAPFVCYDLRFPELVRPVSKQLAAIVYIASWPRTRRHHWRQLLIARAIENQAYCIGVNRIGSDENGLTYQGDSMVVNPMGDVILDVGSRAGCFTADLELNQVHALRDRLPFLRDM